MDQVLPVMVNAGIAGVMCLWFMWRLERKVERFAQAQLQVALQLVQLQLLLPQVPDWLRDRAARDAQALEAKLAQGQGSGQAPVPITGVMYGR